jgi:tetratricopeptide (TPR) repeat protein
LLSRRVYQDAIVAFSLVVDKELNDGPEVLYFRALAYEKLDQLSNSLQDIEKCLEFDPNNEMFLEKYRALEENRSENQNA